MKTFTLFDTEYSLSLQSHDFLSQYLARVERYITRRSLDPSYLEDLKERMKDKLDRIEPPIEKQSIIDLVNELGEPEDIFAETEGEVGEKEVTGNFLARKKRIIFGVALKLSQDLKVPVVYVRLAFIIFMFIYGIGILVYLALSVLLSGIFTWGDREKKDSFLSRLLHASWDLVKSILRIFLIAFLLLIAIIFFLIGISGTIGGFATLSPWIIDGQNILSLVTPSLQITIFIGSLALILIALGIGAYAVRKPIFGRYSTAFLILIITISGALLIGHVVLGIQNFTTSIRKNEIFMTTLSTGTLIVNVGDIPRGRFSPTLGGYGEVIYEEDGTGVTVEVISTLYGKEKVSLEQTSQYLNPFRIRTEGNTLSITPPESSFRTVVPLTPTMRNIIIRIPRGMYVKINSNMWKNTARTELESYTPGRVECEFSYYRYSEKKKAFFCDPRGYSREILDEAMKQYAEEKILYDEFALPTPNTTIVASGMIITTRGSFHNEEGQREIPQSLLIEIDDEGNMYATRAGSGSETGGRIQ